MSLTLSYLLDLLVIIVEIVNFKVVSLSWLLIQSEIVFLCHLSIYIFILFSMRFSFFFFNLFLKSMVVM